MLLKLWRVYNMSSLDIDLSTCYIFDNEGDHILAFNELEENELSIDFLNQRSTESNDNEFIESYYGVDSDNDENNDSDSDSDDEKIINPFQTFKSIECVILPN